MHNENAIGGEAVNFTVRLPLGGLLAEEDIARAVKASRVDACTVRRAAVDENATGEARDGRLLNRLGGGQQAWGQIRGRRGGGGSCMLLGYATALVLLLLLLVGVWVGLRVVVMAIAAIAVMVMAVTVAVRRPGDIVRGGGSSSSCSLVRVKHERVNYHKVNGTLRGTTNLYGY